MAKIVFVYFLITTFQLIGQMSDAKSKKLEGKWLLKEFHLNSPEGYAIDSSKTILEFKQNGIYTFRYSYYINDPTKVRKPIIISGKWKINGDKNLLHLYASNEESPSPHQIPDKDVKIIKLNKKQFVIYESLIYPKHKSRYTREIN